LFEQFQVSKASSKNVNETKKKERKKTLRGGKAKRVSKAYLATRTQWFQCFIEILRIIHI
jgi:hypothetical protein